MNAGTISGSPETMDETAYRQVCGQRGRNVTRTVTLAVSLNNGLVFHSAIHVVGNMNAQRFVEFLRTD